eukprot:317618-Rhodomonas_salina.1
MEVCPGGIQREEEAPESRWLEDLERMIWEGDGAPDQDEEGAEGDQWANDRRWAEEAAAMGIPEGQFRELERVAAGIRG